MIQPEDRIAVHDVFRAWVQRKYAIPFLMDYVQAGFPSPADYVEYDSGHREKQ